MTASLAPSAPTVSRAVTAVEQTPLLDQPVQLLRTLVDRAFGRQQLRDLLHGVPLGHPLHPMLTDVPIGTWTSAVVLDALPGTGAAAATLIAVGIAASAPAAASGLVDWSALHEQQMRVGLVHAAANTLALGLFTASLVRRVRRRRWSGKALSLLGLAATATGGYLGAHLSYRQAAGSNHAESVPHLFPAGWQPLGPLHELPERTLVRREVGGVPLLVFRSAGEVRVLADTCAHLAAPLSGGELVSVDGQDCVRCPWHGSTYRLSDGQVQHGPSTAPQPSLQTRLDGGTVEVLLPGAG